MKPVTYGSFLFYFFAVTAKLYISGSQSGSAVIWWINSWSTMSPALQTCWNSMLMEATERLAIVRNAEVERTMVTASLDGLETEVSARSTILIWMVSSGTQVLGTAALMHRTRYCLPQAAPLSHIPSPADANKLVDGNCPSSFPKQAVGVYGGR